MRPAPGCTDPIVIHWQNADGLLHGRCHPSNPMTQLLRMQCATNLGSYFVAALVQALDNECSIVVGLVDLCSPPVPVAVQGAEVQRLFLLAENSQSI